jgi:hypothetical protein
VVSNPTRAESRRARLSARITGWLQARRDASRIVFQ